MGAKTSKTDIANLKARITLLEGKKGTITTLGEQIVDTSTSAAGAIDYKKLAGIITSTYQQNLSDSIIKDPGSLGDNLAQSLVSNSEAVKGAVKGISNKLESSEKFAKILTSTLSDPSKKYRALIRGEPGQTGNLGGSDAEAKKTLFDSKYTLWCKDDNICQLPVGSKGIRIKGTTISVDNDWLRLLSNPDDLNSYNRGVAVQKLYANNAIYANGGGMNIGGELDSLKTRTADILWILDNKAVRNDRSYELQTDKFHSDGRRLCIIEGDRNQTCDWNADGGRRRFRLVYAHPFDAGTRGDEK